MMERLEDSLMGDSLKEDIVKVFNSIIGGDYFDLKELNDRYTHELIRKDEYGDNLQ